MDRATHGHTVLTYTRKQAEKTNTHAFFTASASVPTSRFLSGVPILIFFNDEL